jgi:hypothetical protein
MIKFKKKDANKLIVNLQLTGMVQQILDFIQQPGEHKLEAVTVFFRF